MMTPEKLSLRLKTSCGIESGAHLLAAVSGGADSVVLLCLLCELRETYPLSLSCAHVEHGIRGEESIADMDFVRALCDEKGIPFYCTRADVPAYAKRQHCGLEEAARELRYAFLKQTMQEIHADCIVLAHHADDQAETVLLHAARGSDIAGLCAMGYRSGDLIRPLIDEQPCALRAYLESIGQSWREDGSNRDVAFTRNRIRHLVLPELEAAISGAKRALARLSAAARRDEDFFEQQICALNLRFVPLVDGAAVPIDAISALHPALLSRIIVRLICDAGVQKQSARTIQRIMEALQLSERVTVNLEGDAFARIGRTHLCVNTDRDFECCVPLDGGMTETPYGCFSVREANENETGDGRFVQAIPKRLLVGARVTGRHAGDSMIPFGRTAPVKIKKLLIDAGVDQGLKASIPVLRAQDGSVLWLVGFRADERCRGKENEEKMIVGLHVR